MRQRRLGRTGLTVSEIGFGSWQLGNREEWDGPHGDEARALVEAAVAAGITLFDTAPNYAAGESERILGEVLGPRRRDVVLVGKFGHTPAGPKEFTVEWFWPSLEASLRRLRTDHLDVLLLHNPPFDLYAGTDPLWKAFDAARSQGMIRHYGASLDFSAEIEACLRNTGSDVLEVLFNILHQEARRAFPAVRAREAGILAKVPLDSGWLTGRYDAKSRFTGIRARWSEADVARRAELVASLDRLTADGRSLAETAIGYVLAYDEVSCVIPGIRTRAQLEANCRAGNRRLGPGERARLESFWEAFTGGGARLLPW